LEDAGTVDFEKKKRVIGSLLSTCRAHNLLGMTDVDSIRCRRCLPKIHDGEAGGLQVAKTSAGVTFGDPETQLTSDHIATLETSLQHSPSSRAWCSMTLALKPNTINSKTKQ
jgi:hypothetical protein